MRRLRTVLRGKVHGRIIELDADLELPDGEEVEGEVRVNKLNHLERAFGGWRDDPALDWAHEAIDRDRHRTQVGTA